MLCKNGRIDDCWDIDGSRDLSDSWTGFTQFTLLEEKPPDGYMLSGERLTKRQVTSSKIVQMKNQDSIMLEDYEEFISLTLEDKEFKETIKNARKNLETSMAPAMPCKTSKKSKHERDHASKTNDSSQNLRVSWKPVNPPGCVWKNLYRIMMRTHIAGKREKSLQHYNLVHKFISMPQAMKIPAAKAAANKEWRNLGVGPDKSQK